MSGRPCQCFYGPVTGHGGHCCLREDTRPVEDLTLGGVMPCGHRPPT